MTWVGRNCTKAVVKPAISLIQQGRALPCGNCAMLVFGGQIPRTWLAPNCWVKVLYSGQPCNEVTPVIRTRFMPVSGPCPAIGHAESRLYVVGLACTASNDG